MIYIRHFLCRRPVCLIYREGETSGLDANRSSPRWGPGEESALGVVGSDLVN